MALPLRAVAVTGVLSRKWFLGHGVDFRLGEMLSR